VSDSPDLIDKTDALLSRYRGNPKAGLESDFPVLTDVYSQPRSPGSPGDIAINRTTGTVENPAATIPDPLAPPEKLLVAEVLHQLAPYLGEMLGGPLRERLDEHLRVALTGFTSQLQIDVNTLVREAVAQAIDRVVSERK
jgi:hypothetical protein